MEQFGLKSIEGNLCKMSLSSSTATEVDEDTVLAPYRIAIEMLEAKLPPYVTIEAKISKAAVKEATKELPEGVNLPGVSFNKSTNLTIK